MTRNFIKHLRSLEVSSSDAASGLRQVGTHSQVSIHFWVYPLYPGPGYHSIPRSISWSNSILWQIKENWAMTRNRRWKDHGPCHRARSRIIQSYLDTTSSSDQARPFPAPSVPGLLRRLYLRAPTTWSEYSSFKKGPPPPLVSRLFKYVNRHKFLDWQPRPGPRSRSRTIYYSTRATEKAPALAPQCLDYYSIRGCWFSRRHAEEKQILWMQVFTL